MTNNLYCLVSQYRRARVYIFRNDRRGLQFVPDRGKIPLLIRYPFRLFFASA